MLNRRRSAVLLVITLLVSLKAFVFPFDGRGSSVKTPTTPTRVSVPPISTSGDFTLSWTASSYLSMGNYQVEESTSLTGYRLIGTVGRTVTSFALNDKIGGSYQYRVRACNVDTRFGGLKCSGWGYSRTISVNSVPSTPAKPTGPSTDDDGSYTISWVKPAGTVTYYSLQDRADSGSWKTVTSSTTALSRSFSGKLNGTYDYRVRACSSSGCSSYSGYKRVTVAIDGGGLVSDHPLTYPIVPAQQKVGAVEGQAGVSGGAASYSIPIALPPGRAGMQPSVSLNYSSRGGNGIAGVGWSVSAGSSIHRCGKIADIDNRNYGVTYSASTDKLCLDGKRLILVSGSYGVSGATYHTEMDSFATITQTGGINSSTSNFEVEYPDGKIAEYGVTLNSRHDPDGRSQNLTWAINEQRDLSGNTITYVYSEYAAGEHLLDSIYYTGKDAAQGNRRVDFEYSTNPREDRWRSYLGGASIQHSKLLDAISTFYGST